MTKGKWMFLLVLLLGTLFLVGCGGNGDKTPVPGTQQTQDNKEEPKAEAPKTEAPKTEEPKAEAPKTEAPKTEAPKTEAAKTEAASKPVLNLGHNLSDTYVGKCKTCHAGKAMLDPQPPHNIDANIADCATCHTLNPKKS